MTNKGESDRLSLAVRSVMKKNKVRHADLALALKVSVPTMKRILSRGPLSIDRLMEICDALEISFYELVDLAKENSADALEWMTEAQEKFLLERPDATEYLIHLMNGATPEKIQYEKNLSPTQTRMYLVQLEGQGLVHKSSSGKTFKVSSRVLRGARPGGALARDFSQRCSEVVPQMVNEGLTTSSHKTVAIGYRLSSESRQEIHEELKGILNRFSSVERKETRSLPTSKLGPLTVVVSIHEKDLYSTAYRNSLR